jgi:Flp pilus assembly protein TadD
MGVLGSDFAAGFRATSHRKLPEAGPDLDSDLISKYLESGPHEALAMVDKSLALNPNSVGGLLAHARLLSYLGDTETAIAQLQRVTRLSPVDVRPWRTEFDYAMTHFTADPLRPRT